MENLSKKRCLPCENIGERLEKALIDKYMKTLKGWKIDKNKHLSKTYKFKDFKSALSFTNKLGKIAEKEGHHPDILLSWGKVQVTLFTHAMSALTINDFILASKTDILYKKAKPQLS